MLNVLWERFVGKDEVRYKAIEGMKDVVLCGLMVGSAIVSPILVDAQRVWHLLVTASLQSSFSKLTRLAICSYLLFRLEALPSGIARI